MYGQLGGNMTGTNMTFVSNIAYMNDIQRQLNLHRLIRPVKNIRNHVKQI